VPLKLLMVDEDPSSRTLLREALEAKEADLFVAHNLQTGSPAVDQYKFDGIFLDLYHPAINAAEFTEQIRVSARNSQTTIVLVGGISSPSAVRRCFSAGANAFLPKPLERNNLQRALSSIRSLILEERRRNRRISLSNPVQCLVGAREVPGCLIRNLSMSGMLLYTDGNLEVREEVRLLFHVDHASPHVMAKGVVVRVDELGQAGIRVDWSSSADRVRVRGCIAKEVDNI
jgi:CheY-like chemotaxis protein